MIDDVDRRILGILQENARTPNAGIARQLDMAPSAIHERIRKLEDTGIIQGYEARLNPKALGFGLVAFIAVRTQDRWGHPDTAVELAKIPEVQEIHAVAGEDCYLIKVRTADVEALRRILIERVRAPDSIVGTRTTIVLGTVKESARLPVDAARPVRAVAAGNGRARLG